MATTSKQQYSEVSTTQPNSGNSPTFISRFKFEWAQVSWPFCTTLSLDMPSTAQDSSSESLTLQFLSRDHWKLLCILSCLYPKYAQICLISMLLSVSPGEVPT